tara:strand:- start:161 stop:409 length:249 start_codon:yes stop_codon:yes gene_type:complete
MMGNIETNPFQSACITDSIEFIVDSAEGYELSTARMDTLAMAILNMRYAFQSWQQGKIYLGDEEIIAVNEAMGHINTMLPEF